MLTPSKALFLKEEIVRLKKEKNILILAHYYQADDIQEIADFVGDSLELSRKAVNDTAQTILFAGVYFMAETAKILNPNKTILVPDKSASCSLEESCNPVDYQEFTSKHPNAVKVTYINSSAEVKAQSDIICTSSNAEKIINSISPEQEIVFAPDKNLGRYLMEKTGRKMNLWDGECIVHAAFSMDKLLLLMKANPNAKIIAHPESEHHILKIADFIGSTAALLRYVSEDSTSTYIVATEVGILYKMRLAEPHKSFIPAPIYSENTCECSTCAFMKVNTLEKVYASLVHDRFEVKLNSYLQEQASKSILKMLELS